MNKEHELSFIIKMFDRLTDKKEYELPSHYIERVRALDKEISPIPGFYKFSRTPFWKEILDNMSPKSPYQKIVVMKGVQIGATTGILENIIAYNIGCDPKPQLYISADKELVKMNMEIKVERMIDSCKLRDRIFSQTGVNTKKTGDTSLQKDYIGGFLIAIGAQNPGKLRSMSFPVILFDELDGMPDKIGKEGDPVSLADNRTNAYASKRKILYISTPLVEQTSKIYKLYKEGDQRKFFVPCIKCKKKQELIFHGITETGHTYGIVFSHNNGEIDYSSVGYKCKYCGHIMKNHDKSIILQEGEWISTSKSKDPKLISYHISALYSAVGMFSWEDIVQKWNQCWDIKNNRLKDKEKYREFRNLMQGLPFEERGEAIRADKVKQNRSYHYLKNQINNKKFIEETGSGILLLTSAVDVQKNGLWVDIRGWCERGISYLIDAFFIEGETENYNSIVWKQLDDIVMNKNWISDDEKIYRINSTFIDSGKYTDYVYEFCKHYSYGVYAIKGNDYIQGGLTYKAFNRDTILKAGLSLALHINTTKQKDFIARTLNLSRETNKLLPDWYINFPNDFADDYFDHYSAENRIDEYDKITNKYIRTRWKLTAGRENHLFDTHCYNLANLEFFAFNICKYELNIEYLNWKDFWEYSKQGYFYDEIK